MIRWTTSRVPCRLYLLYLYQVQILTQKAHSSACVSSHASPHMRLLLNRPANYRVDFVKFDLSLSLSLSLRLSLLRARARVLHTRGSS